MTMRKILNLYLSYLKASLITMAAAGVVFPLYAAVLTGRLSPVSGVALAVGFLALAYLVVVRLVGHRQASVSQQIASPNIQLNDTGEGSNSSSTSLIDQTDADKMAETDLSADLQSPEEVKKPVTFMSHEVRERERREEAILKEALRDVDTENSERDAAPVLNFSLVKPSAEFLPTAKIKVVGIGGGGGNAVDRMIETGVAGVEFLAVNTDAQALKYSRAHRKIQIGAQQTRGLGVGGDPKLGRQAALEDTKKIVEALKGLDMVFLTAGLGGGTGTGAIPIFARIAKELGVLTVAIVTMPFSFEGHVRRLQAEEGLAYLQDKVDTLIVVHNDGLLVSVTEETSLIESFRLADDILRQAVQGISDIITVPGFINVDFADVKTIMSGSGVALMGTGGAAGKLRATRAIHQAINSPLLEGVSIKGAGGLLINVTGGEDLTLHEVNEAMTRISEIADPEANIIFGAVVDEDLVNEVKITVIATHFRGRGTQGGAHSNVPDTSEPSEQEETNVIDLKRKGAQK